MLGSSCPFPSLLTQRKFYSGTLRSGSPKAVLPTAFLPFFFHLQTSMSLWLRAGSCSLHPQPPRTDAEALSRMEFGVKTFHALLKELALFGIVFRLGYLSLCSSNCPRTHRDPLVFAFLVLIKGVHHYAWLTMHFWWKIFKRKLRL